MDHPTAREQVGQQDSEEEISQQDSNDQEACDNQHEISEDNNEEVGTTAPTYNNEEVGTPAPKHFYPPRILAIMVIDAL